MSKNHVEVFLGHPVDDRAELRVLNRLRADLERRGIRARIHANFLAGRHQRQVDLLIVTEQRLVHAELKNVDPALRLVSEVNGPWRQRLPGGTERQLDRNGCRQARDTTQQISDDMRALAHAGAAPRAPREFFHDIDTVVCLHPEIPPGSQLAPLKFVTVVSYAGLLDRLASPGPVPAWSREHWDAFARRLGLYPEPTDTPAERNKHQRLARVADYQMRFATQSAAGLHELVPTAADVDGDAVASVLDPLVDAARTQRLVTVTGPSEAGKTHAARHAAVALARVGATPVWMPCRDYEKGRFAVALALAVAPYTTVPARQLLSDAADAGSPVTVVLDGFNECPSELQDELLAQLAALRLRLPVAAVITSTQPVPLADTADVTRVQLTHPDPDARDALLVSYGAPAGLPGADALVTALELTLAARCAADLPADATRTDVLDAYVRSRCPAETVRGALRRLAASMDERIRLSLPMTEAMTVLRASAGAPDELVDQILGCPLLTAGQGRLAFAHETLGRFLAAEHHVVTSGGTAELGAALRQPHRDDLREYAIAMQPDGERRAALLLTLAEPKQLAAAARGELGAATATAVCAQVVRALEKALRDTPAASFEMLPGPQLVGEWSMLMPRTEAEHALLIAAALCLPAKLFIAEAAMLLDAADDRCAQAVGQLREDGHRMPFTVLVQSTYTRVFTGGQNALRQLGASVIAHTCDLERMFRWESRSAAAPATALLTATTAAPRWGRLYTALHLLNPASETDLRALPDLVRDAWAANGYHLRLEALFTAERYAAALDDDTARRMLDVLRSFDPGENWALSSTLVEALAALDDIEPAVTLTDITTQIAAVLSLPDDREALENAQHLIGMQFENETVLGPYGEAITELSDGQRLQLCVMAMRSGPTPYHADWAVAYIADHAQPGDAAALAVLRQQAVTVHVDVPMPQESVAAHVEALRGLARLAEDLPPAASSDGDLQQHAWRLLDQLVFALLRQDSPAVADAQLLWVEALELCPAETVLALYHLHGGGVLWRHHEELSVHERLVETYPEQLRRLHEWALCHRDVFPPAAAAHVATDWRDQFIIRELGRVGTRGTANLLRGYLDDPQLGKLAVSAIRDIERRIAAG